MVQSGESISFIFVLLKRFAWLCENFAWSCEITFHNSLMCCSQYPFCFISHGHAKLKNMFFRLLFAISPIFSFLIQLHHLQFSSKAWSKPITLLLSLYIWIIINFICFLQFDSSHLSPIYQNQPWNDSKTSQNLLVTLARAKTC